MTVSLCTALPRVVDRRTKNGFPERVAAVEVDGITAQVSQDLLLGSVVLRTRRTRADTSARFAPGVQLRRWL